MVDHKDNDGSPSGRQSQMDLTKSFFLFVCLLHQKKSDLDHWRESFSTCKEGSMTWKSNSVI